LPALDRYNAELSTAALVNLINTAKREAFTIASRIIHLDTGILSEEKHYVFPYIQAQIGQLTPAEQ